MPTASISPASTAWWSASTAVRVRCRSRPNVQPTTASRQLPFQLPAAVAMDLEGTMLIATRVLSRAEFVRAIQIRGQQIANDRKALREWQQALKAADRFWAEHPDWSFGECLDAILRSAGSSTTAGEGV